MMIKLHKQEEVRLALSLTSARGGIIEVCGGADAARLAGRAFLSTMIV